VTLSCIWFNNLVVVGPDAQYTMGSPLANGNPTETKQRWVRQSSTLNI
jgi:hypothetical protein